MKIMDKSFLEIYQKLHDASLVDHAIVNSKHPNVPHHLAWNKDKILTSPSQFDVATMGVDKNSLWWRAFDLRYDESIDSSSANLYFEVIEGARKGSIGLATKITGFTVTLDFGNGKTFNFVWDSDWIKYRMNFTGPAKWSFKRKKKEDIVLPTIKNKYGEELNDGDFIFAALKRHGNVYLTAGHITRRTENGTLFMEPYCNVDFDQYDLTKNGELPILDPEQCLKVPQKNVEEYLHMVSLPIMLKK